jgi:hypothetical protein
MGSCYRLYRRRKSKPQRPQLHRSLLDPESGSGTDCQQRRSRQRQALDHRFPVRHNAHSDAYSDSDTYPDAYAHTDAYTHSYPDTDSHADTHSDQLRAMGTRSCVCSWCEGNQPWRLLSMHGSGLVFVDLDRV